MAEREDHTARRFERYQDARADMQTPTIISVVYCHLLRVSNVAFTGMGKLWEKKITTWKLTQFLKPVKYWSLLFYHEELFSVVDNNMDTLYHPNQ
jgi:hypothetical protein